LSTDFIREQAIRALEENVEEISELSRWPVYEHYKLIFDEAGNRYIYAPRRRGNGHIDAPRRRGEVDNKVVRRLEPLSRTSADLFLRFARWPKETRMDRQLDTERNAEAALLWVKTFGVLGLKPADFAIRTLLSSHRVTEDYLGMPEPGGTDRGRQNLATGGMPEESVANFAFEAWEAHIVWQLYESVRTEGRVEDDTVIQFMSTINHWEAAATWDITGGEPVPVEASWVEREIFSEDSELVRRWALTIVEDAVNRKIESHCFPIVHGTPGSYKQDWGFRSLLGAMWLQMMFLMYEDRRCWWCGRPLDPGKKSHARFCDNNGKCRAAWNYHQGEGKSSKESRRKERYIR
jgi:hypothetical protein